jgi:type III pantothenate kinase
MDNGDMPALERWLGQERVAQVVIGSVAGPQPEWMDGVRRIAPVFEVLGITPTPLTSMYDTPNTLGVDRLANAVAAAALFPGRAVLVIDAGTCITYDMVESDGTYSGGAIGPGMMLRSKAMHDYSARLPLVVPGDDPQILGATTEQSLASGVHHGMVGEILGFIASLGYQRPRMAVVLTGGDGLRFARAVKSGIFAHPLLTLQGLHAIHLHNRALDHSNVAAAQQRGARPGTTG